MKTEPQPEAPLLLALETSTAVCSVALQRGDTLLAVSETYAPQHHSRLLTVLVAQLLHNLSIPFTALGGVAVASGPGSYTGLRIATSAAKGYCQGLGIPLVAVPTLAALAARVQPLAIALGARIRPVLDARRQEVFTALYDSSLRPLAAYEPRILTPDAFAGELAAGPVLFVGDGAAKTDAMLNGHRNAHFLPEMGCSASTVARLGMQQFLAGEHASLEDFEPFYGKTVSIGQSLPQPQTPPQ